MLTPDIFSAQQTQAVKDILTRRVMCITSDCGFGKTVVGLTAIAIMKKKYPDYKALVVCTSEGVRGTWAKEHSKWSHLTHLRVISLLGTPKQRLDKLKGDGDVFAITYNNLKWLVDNNRFHQFNFVFADEGDCLKGATSKWRKNLIQSAPKAKWRIISTATPKTRNEDDYWGLCKYLDNGKCLESPTITEFRARYMTQLSHNGRRFYTMRKKAIPELENRIKHLFVNYELSDNAEIPIKTITVNAKLSVESQAKYDKLEREQCLNGIADTEEPLDALAMSAKLDQLSSGFVYVDDSLRISEADLMSNMSATQLLNKTAKRKTVDVFDDRVRAIRKLVDKIREKHDNAPIVMCYYYTHEKNQLLSQFPNALTDTDDDFVNKWNTGDYDYLLLQYSRSSKSLNLQQGGNIMVFYSPTFKWVDDYQIIRRLARQGQPRDCVYAYRLYLNGTIDDVKVKRLDERFQGHSRFQKKILKRLQDVDSSV